MPDKKVGILKILTLADILLIAGIIILGTVSLFVMRATGLEGKNVEIFFSSRLAGIYPLYENRTITFEGKTGEIVIKISNGMVWIEETSCPHKICQRMGKKKNVNELIVCVPNEMIIQIVGKKKKEIEAITQ